MLHGDGFFMGGMHLIWWIFWFGLVVLLLAYGWGWRRDRPGEQADSPHDILKRRLARGDITPQEYESRKLLLDRDAGSGA